MNRFVHLLLPMLLALGVPAHADEHGAATTLGLDRFAAGGDVDVREPVEGDLIAAGGHVRMASPVKADAIGAGGEVRVESDVGQGLYAAGGRVWIGGHVARNARVAGGHVDLAANGSIDGNLTVAGGEVSILGPVHGYVQAVGGRVRVDGPVGGDVVVSAGHLELGPHARVSGKVRYRGGDLVRDPGAEVIGGVSQAERGHAPAGVRRTGARLAAWIWTVGLMVLAALFALALPSLGARLAPALAERPAIAVLVGFAALVAIPAAAALMAITVIGLPLALLAILLYLALLLVGYVAAGVALGDAAVRSVRADAGQRTGWRVLAAALAVLVLALLGRVPYVGAVVSFAVLIVGVGALLVAAFPRAGSTASPAAAPAAV